MVAVLAAEGHVELVQDRAAILACLRAAETVPTLLIADLTSTLTREDSLDGYREFVSAYHAARSYRALALLILNPPAAEWPGGTCIGWAALIDAYLTIGAGEPVDVALLAQFVRRIREECFPEPMASNSQPSVR